LEVLLNNNLIIRISLNLRRGNLEIIDLYYLQGHLEAEKRSLYHHDLLRSSTPLFYSILKRLHPKLINFLYQPIPCNFHDDIEDYIGRSFKYQTGVVLTHFMVPNIGRKILSVSTRQHIMTGNSLIELLSEIPKEMKEVVGKQI
jgi:hypothetical protein